MPVAVNADSHRASGVASALAPGSLSVPGVGAAVGSVDGPHRHAASAPAAVRPELAGGGQPVGPQSVCPYEVCPGIFEHCGGAMRRFALPDGEAWRCMACGFSALGEPQEGALQLAMEVVPAANDNRGLAAEEREPVRVFVRPLGRARRAVQSAGGVLAVLQQQAGVDVAAAVEVGPEYVAFEVGQLPGLRARLRAQRLLDACGADVPGWAEASFAGRVRGEDPEEVAAAMRRMPATLLHSLMPFQEEGVRFGLERRGRCLIGDEMGAPCCARQRRCWSQSCRVGSSVLEAQRLDSCW